MKKTLQKDFQVKVKLLKQDWRNIACLDKLSSVGQLQEKNQKPSKSSSYRASRKRTC